MWRWAAHSKAGPRRSLLKFLVARTRFELVISALRGRRPKPLDERAVCVAPLRRKNITGCPHGTQAPIMRIFELWRTCEDAWSVSLACGACRSLIARDVSIGDGVVWCHRGAARFDGARQNPDALRGGTFRFVCSSAIIHGIAKGVCSKRDVGCQPQSETTAWRHARFW